MNQVKGKQNKPKPRNLKIDRRPAMSRITLNPLASVQTMDRQAMAETTGGSLFPFPRPRPRIRCFFVRTRRFPFFRRVCVPVF
jgi:hypothetical protein